jgi:phosphinothricin acetyltransferase
MGTDTVEINIRLARPDDAAGIRSIMSWFTAMTTCSWRYRPMDLEETEQWLGRHMNRPEHQVWVADKDGQVIGYGCLSDFRAPEGYWPCAENSIYVLPEYSGRGIGSQLMERILTQAIHSDLQVIVAAIDSSNKDSIRFHQRFGFIRSGYLRHVGWKQDRWLNLLFMTCDLNQERYRNQPSGESIQSVAKGHERGSEEA